MASVNVTVGMSPEMLDKIDDEADKYGVSRARYIREAIRDADTTPFDADDVDLQVNDDDAAEAQMGGA